MKRMCFALGAVLLAGNAFAADPDILDVSVEKVGTVWNVRVTVAHPDIGWDHYADGWEVLDASGNRLGYRKLLHPHVDEQPFTRSLSGIVIPDGTREIFVKARCSVDGWSDTAMRVALLP